MFSPSFSSCLIYLLKGRGGNIIIESVVSPYVHIPGILCISTRSSFLNKVGVICGSVTLKVGPDPVLNWDLRPVYCCIFLHYLWARVCAFLGDACYEFCKQELLN